MLEIEELSVTFRSHTGAVPVLDRVSLAMERGESLALMGETGCGKSVLCHAVMRLLEGVAEVSGQVRFQGRDVYSLPWKEVRKMRGKGISLVPQSPSAAFNPVMRVGDQIREYVEKRGSDHQQTREISLAALRSVGLDAEAVYRSYPHMLSGGMAERALIAMAISVDPELVIADEPTKGLDLPSRRGILELLGEVSKERSTMIITHDFQAARSCQRTAVMYSGQIVEEGPTEEVIVEPKHPYTAGLLRAQPSNGMEPIPGRHREADRELAGCRFRSRCPHRGEECSRPVPVIEYGERRVRCFHAGDD
ncbi:MAG: ABC transporter ATP-binding protein [Methanomassiliicoccales archaeon]